MPCVACLFVSDQSSSRQEKGCSHGTCLCNVKFAAGMTARPPFSLYPSVLWGSARQPPPCGPLWLWYRVGLKVWSRWKRSSASLACSSCNALARLFLCSSVSGLACNIMTHSGPLHPSAPGQVQGGRMGCGVASMLKHQAVAAQP